jgi:hypothetical protein
MSPERSLRVKNRMRVIRTSGSVRGGDGNIPAYSAARQPDIARPGQSPESGIAVDLNDALELRQMGDWALGPAITGNCSGRTCLPVRLSLQHSQTL